MTNDDVTQAMKELLDRATPPLSAEWETRAEQAMTRRKPRFRPTRRVVAVGVFAAVIVLALGLNPFRWGKTTPALAQAAAAALQAKTMHVWGVMGEKTSKRTFEVWESRDGFRRFELRSGGRLEFLELWQGGAETWHFADEGQGLVRVAPPEYARLYNWWDNRNGVELLAAFHPFARLCPDIRAREYEVSGSAGETVTVVEAEGTVTDREYHDAAYGVALNGTPLKFRAEVDPGTERLRSLSVWHGAGTPIHQDPKTGKWVPGRGLVSTLWRRFGTEWEPVYQTLGVEWDRPLPPDVGQFAWPAGTVVRYDRWWETRGATELASATLPEGKVIVHALDVNERGDIYVSFSRPGYRSVAWWDAATNQYPPEAELEAVDDDGHVFSRSSRLRDIEGPQRDYLWTSVSCPESGNAPSRISLTIWPWGKDTASRPGVTFRELTVPSRQRGEDLPEEMVERVRY